jgi:cytochrome c553
VRNSFASIQWTAALLLCAGPAAGADAPPWAYPLPPPNLVQHVDDGNALHVPDSSASYTLTQLGNLYEAVDWHPEDHPALPAVVAHGHPPDVYACGYCHRADGSGGPENARLAGLPYGYVLQQLADFKSGARRTAVPGRRPQAVMAAVAKALSEDDARAAAAYFATLKPRHNIRVVETTTVPRTISAGWFLVAAPGAATEAIGRRIIEVPEDVERFERRDARAGFVAYVPPGSLGKGAAFVAGTVPGKTLPCATCHGAGLRGLGNAPGIAGRSPSYVVRQLYDIQTGARAGQAAQAMKGVVMRLDAGDMIAIAAYLASLEP